MKIHNFIMNDYKFFKSIGQVHDVILKFLPKEFSTLYGLLNCLGGLK